MKLRQLVLAALFCASAATAATPPRTARQWYDQGVLQYYIRHMPEAVNDFKAAVKLDPDDPMPHLMLSRALLHNHQDDQAFTEAETALTHVNLAVDSDSYIVKSWDFHMRATKNATEAPHDNNEAGRIADQGICIYPYNADLYILRGELTGNAMQATPYFMAALSVQPNHPLGQRWRPTVPPIPKVDCGPGDTMHVTAKPPPVFDGLGKLHHVIVTSNPKAQVFFDEGLCCLYAYVTPWAQRYFEAAIQADPKCAMAYWGLSFAPPMGHPPLGLAEKGLALAKDNGSEAERRYCSARVLQLQPGKGDQFLDALSGAIARYPRDVDLWIWRGTPNGFLGESGDEDHSTNGIPFVLQAWRIQPDHPSANHELLHAYEVIDRPLLGWRYSWGFRRSAPHMPHAQHMQAHLAMRLGRWKDAMECTRESVRLSNAGYPELDRSHHINVYYWALGHEGRFKEASTAVRSPNQDLSYPMLLRMKLDDNAMAQWAEKRRAHMVDGWYIGALADLDHGDWKAAQEKARHLGNHQSVWTVDDVSAWKDEIAGRALLESGKKEAGLDKLRSLARWEDNLPEAHRWGQGSYFDELWGEAALKCGNLDDAQEAFAEGLAHEHGCIVAALGLQVVYARKHNAVETAYFTNLSKQIWVRADPGARERLLARMNAIADGQAHIF